MTQPWAYVYRADLYCRQCILPKLGVSPSEDEDLEARLDDLARERGIDRYHEDSYDSGDFPKIAFFGELSSGDCCGRCGSGLR